MKKKHVEEQFLLFEKPKSEMEHLWEMVISLKESHRKVQKRLFGELADIKENMIEISAENEQLRFQILNKKLSLYEAKEN